MLIEYFLCYDCLYWLIMWSLPEPLNYFLYFPQWKMMFFGSGRVWTRLVQNNVTENGQEEINPSV